MGPVLMMDYITSSYSDEEQTSCKNFNKLTVLFYDL